MNIANLLVRAGRCFGSNPAVALGENVLLDYQHLAARVSALAGAFCQQLQLVPGDRIGLAMRNTPAYLELLFAAWHAGLVVVPINSKLAQRELAYILDNSGARVCFVTPDLLETVQPLTSSVQSLERVIETDSSDYAALLNAAPIDLTARKPDDPAWLFYTSGTTGMPKGAVLTHRNLGAMTAGYFSDVDQLSPGETLLHAAPMSHGSGLYILPHVAAANLNLIPESDNFDPTEIFQLLLLYPAVSMFAAPTMVRRLTAAAEGVDVDVSNLKTVIYGGGPMYLDDLRAAMERFGNRFAQIYGQGESPMTITALSKAMHATASAQAELDQRLTSVGIPQSLVEVQIKSPRGACLPPGEVGEICVRGDVVMAGYWQDAAATAEALVDGWLHTGDMGCFDENGYLYLKDRSKDLIISGGSNIYPREVEEVLLQHEAVAEVSVLGQSDPEWGELVVAFVVAQPNVQLTAELLDAHCLQHLARFKRPRRYHFVCELPKNAYGKILKTELRLWLEQPPAALSEQHSNS